MDDNRLWRQFNLSSEDISAIHAVQQGACAICGRPLEIGKASMCVDHSHADGLNRGLLCWLCNRALGLFGDDIERLKAAVAYLLNPTAPQAIGQRFGHIGRASTKHGHNRRAGFYRRGESATGGRLYRCGCRDCGARPQKVCPVHGQPVETASLIDTSPTC